MSRILATANKKFFATNIVVSLLGQFAASLPCGEHRRQHRPPESAHLERRDPRGRRPSGGGTLVLQLPRVLPGPPPHAACSPHGGRAKPDRLLPPHAGADRPVGERLDEKERVRGAGSGEGRDNVEQFLARGIRPPPRGDRDKELPLHVARPDLAERLPHALRLDREDDRVALPEEVRHPPRGRDAEPLAELPPASGPDVQDDHLAGRDKLRRKDPPDHRLPHVPRPDKTHSLHDSLLARLPKMAVPTRSIVAPSSIAPSKSFDLPIESSVHPGPAPPRRAHSSNSSRSRLKYGLLSSGSSVHGGMAINPRRRMPGRPGAASISAGNPPGVHPPLVPP